MLLPFFFLAKSTCRGVDIADTAPRCMLFQSSAPCLDMCRLQCLGRCHTCVRSPTADTCWREISRHCTVRAYVPCVVHMHRLYFSPAALPADLFVRGISLLSSRLSSFPCHLHSENLTSSSTSSSSLSSSTTTTSLSLFYRGAFPTLMVAAAA